jgi:hypothetical protein
MISVQHGQGQKKKALYVKVITGMCMTNIKTGLEGVKEWSNVKECIVLNREEARTKLSPWLPRLFSKTFRQSGETEQRTGPTERSGNQDKGSTRYCMLNWYSFLPSHE